MNTLMIRLILLAFGTLVATTLHGEELCSERDRRIEPDMQIQEADFTLESYDKALDSLATLGHEPRNELSWIAEGNAMKFVTGWLLKKAAIESLGATANSDGRKQVDMFCEFLVNDAFYYD